MDGNFISGQELIGSTTGATWTFNSYNIATEKYADIVITPAYGPALEDLETDTGSEDIMTEIGTEDLLTITSDNGPIDPYTYNTVITDYPNT